MSDEKIENENLNDSSEFEASLAALHPQADGLEGRRRFVAAAAHRFCLGITPADADEKARVMFKHNLRRGRSVVCLHCGGTIEIAGDRRRWAWPAAFSAMTAVSAALFIVILLRPDSPAMKISPLPLAGEGSGVRAGQSLEIRVQGSESEKWDFLSADSRRIAVRQSGGVGPRILSAADTRLPDDFSWYVTIEVKSGVSQPGDIKAAEATLTNRELLHQLTEGH
jgi:hypothetical protein